MELLDDRYTDDRCTKSIRYTDDILTNVMCETFRDLKEMYLHAQSAWVNLIHYALQGMVIYCKYDMDYNIVYSWCCIWSVVQ